MSYIQSRISTLQADHNNAHAQMLSAYLQSPILFNVSEQIADDLVSRGEGLEIQYSLPYHTMAVEINKLISFQFEGKMQHIRIEKIWMNVAEVHSPDVSDTAIVVARNLIKKCKWLISNMTSLDDIHLISELPHAIDQFTGLVSLYVSRKGSISIQEMRDLVRELCTRWVNLYLMEEGQKFNQLNAKQGFSWFCTYTNLNTRERNDVYDWWNTDPMFDELHELNNMFFNDGYNNHIVKFATDFILGFVNAWNDRQIVEKLSTKNTKVRLRNGKKKKVAKTVRTLKYDLGSGSVVTTTTNATESKNEANTGREQAPHTRRGTDALVWVLESNLREGEAVLDRKKSSTEKILCQVKRWRKEAKVKGGGAVKGVIKAV